ncbi:hypothetical protein B7463_g1684, partial [Scytalidium lignicola]
MAGSKWLEYIGFSVFTLISIGIYFTSTKRINKSITMGKSKSDGDTKEDVAKKTKKKKEKGNPVAEKHGKVNNVPDSKDFKKALKAKKKQAKELGLVWDEEAEEEVLRKELEEQSKQISEKRPENSHVANHGHTNRDELRNTSEVKEAGSDSTSEDEKAKKKDRKKERKERRKREKANASLVDLTLGEETIDEVPANPAKAARKEKKRLRKEEGIRSEPAKKDISDTESKKSSKRRKRSKEDDANSIMEKPDRKYSKSHSSTKTKSEDQSTERSGAEQWNPDALSGDAARKSKFLRLLGVGKADPSQTSLHSQGEGNSSEKAAEISRVQEDLEHQFNAGIRMKHDGSGKRRGLGA